MPTFEQEWLSPILEVFSKRKLEDPLSIILGLNPLGQALCRQLYEEVHFETVLIFNSPSFSTWNRYPVTVKPPVVPVHGMINDELMLIFGDVLIKDYEWVTDMLFYIRGNVPSRFVIAMMTYDGRTCGQVLSKKGGRLLERMDIPLGQSDYYDGLTAPLLSLGPPADLDPVVLFLEAALDREILYQIGDIAISFDEVERSRILLNKGLDLRLKG
ncbi:MAG: hypothetical protein JSW61_09440 [Candidatus Thorarchaeota archaeon]|nr:MAG: hypothetical protein JSW61_09440 [Candidatus Thorarchaeota archaeon]